MPDFAFAHPLFLFVLLAAPLALLLAFLTKRETRHRVATLLPWRSLLALPRPRPQRNPFDLETACAILLPVATALSLAGPILRWPAPGERLIIAVIDDGLSLQTRRPGKKSRLEQAVDWLRRLGQRHPDSRFTLYATDRLAPLAEGVAATEAALLAQRLTPSRDAEANRQAVLMAALTAAAQKSAAVVWISDRRPPFSSPRLAEILVGEPSENLALLSAAYEEEQKGAFAAVANFSRRAREALVEWRQEAAADAELIAAQRLTLAPGEIRGLLLHPQEAMAQTPARSFLQLRLPEGEIDDFPADNQAAVETAARRICAIDRGVLPRCALALAKAAGCGLRPLTEAEGAAVAVSDRPLPSLPQQAVIIVAPQEPFAGLISLEGECEAQAPAISEGPWPLPAACLAGLQHFRLTRAILPAGAEVLATARAGNERLPLVAEWEWEGRRIFFLAIAESEWSAQPGFPIMLTALAERAFATSLPSLPGIAVSDNRLSAAPTAEMPDLPAVGRQDRRLSISRLLAVSAALCAIFAAHREWQRQMAKSYVFVGHGVIKKRGLSI